MPQGKVFPTEFDELIHFKNLKEYNDAHPDELHKMWMEKYEGKDIRRLISPCRGCPADRKTYGRRICSKENKKNCKEYQDYLKTLGRE